MIRRTRFLWIVAALVGTLSSGCGTTGSRPTIYPEVQFHVQTHGGSTFTVNELDAGGVQHTFSDGTTFTISGTNFFDFYFENAKPPYFGKFTVSSGSITVSLFLPSPTGARTLPGQEVAPGVIAVSSGPTIAVTPATQEVRFDVCVPSLTPGTCFTGGDEGVPGLSFSGNVGDASQTHLLTGFTPSTYFLEGAQDSVNAVFRLAPMTGQTLVAQLFINGALTETQAGTQNVIIRQDL